MPFGKPSYAQPGRYSKYLFFKLIQRTEYSQLVLKHVGLRIDPDRLVDETYKLLLKIKG